MYSRFASNSCVILQVCVTIFCWFISLVGGIQSTLHSQLQQVVLRCVSMAVGHVLGVGLTHEVDTATLLSGMVISLYLL